MACLFLIAAAISVAMSFVAHERKVSFECCRPYKPTTRLSLGRSRHFVWAPDRITLSSGCSEIGTGSSNSPRSANESQSLLILRSAGRNSLQLRLHSDRDAELSRQPLEKKSSAFNGRD